MNPVGFYKCLADETRLQCLLLITRNKELCVCELTDALDVSQPKISRHLAQLRKCQLLSDRREGKWVYYRLHPELPQWQVTVLQETLEANNDFLSDATDRLAECDTGPSGCC
jgi:ArsR family transcriptional regulator